MKYKVGVHGSNSQQGEVEANNEEDALDKASDGDGEILGEGGDLDNVELCDNDE